MICVALSDKSISKCLAELDKVELAEIRIDLTEFGVDEIEKCFSHKTPTVATCRPDTLGKTEQLNLLSAAIKAGANYVDIEIEADRDHQEAIIELAKKHKCKVIISYHNYEKTPGLKELYELVDRCFELGADVAKIAAQANSKADSARLLSLYSITKPLVILGMGNEGKITRIVSSLLGAEFTFAAMDEGDPTAPGQINYSKMNEIIGLLNTELESTKQ